jgi:hypothetical protein
MLHTVFILKFVNVGLFLFQAAGPEHGVWKEMLSVQQRYHGPSLSAC